MSETRAGIEEAHRKHLERFHFALFTSIYSPYVSSILVDMHRQHKHIFRYYNSHMIVVRFLICFILQLNVFFLILVHVYLLFIPLYLCFGFNAHFLVSFSSVLLLSQ